MKKTNSFLIFVTFFVTVLFSFSFSANAESSKTSVKVIATPAQDTNSSTTSTDLKVIVNGSGCLLKPKKPVSLKLVSDTIAVPVDFEVSFDGSGLKRKTCQARITVKGQPGEAFEIREVSQSLLFSLQKKSEMKAELSYGFVGQQDFRIDQKVSEPGEFRHILVKKMINYSSPCGKDAIFRIQTDVQSNGASKNTFTADPVQLTIEKKSCSL